MPAPQQGLTFGGYRKKAPVDLPWQTIDEGCDLFLAVRTSQWTARPGWKQVSTRQLRSGQPPQQAVQPRPLRLLPACGQK